MEPAKYIRTNTAIEAIKCLEKLNQTLFLIKEDIYQWKWSIIVLHNCIQNYMVLALMGTNQADVILDNTKSKKHITDYLNPNYKFLCADFEDFKRLYKKNGLGEIEECDFINIYTKSGLDDQELLERFKHLYMMSKVGSATLEDYFNLYVELERLIERKLNATNPKLDKFLSLYEKIKSQGNMQRYVDSITFKSSKQQDEAMVDLNRFRNDFIHFFPKGWSIQVDGLSEIFNHVIEIVEFLVFQSRNCYYQFDDNQILDTTRLIASIRMTLEALCS